MRYGVHLGCWGPEYDAEQLAQHLAQAAELGAQTFETRIPESILAGDERFCEQIRQAQTETGVQAIYTFRFPQGYEMNAPEEESRQLAQDYLRLAIRRIAKAGGTMLGGIVYSRWPADYQSLCIDPKGKRERFLRSIEGIRSVMPTAESEGVTLNLEVVNRFEHYLINTLEEGLDFCRCVESPNCKLLADVFHMNIEEDDIPAAIRAAKGKIGHFHVSEPNRKIPHPASRICWPEIGKALRETGYGGSVTIESFLMFLGEASQNMRIWRDLEPDVSFLGRMQLLRQGLHYIKDCFENDL